MMKKTPPAPTLPRVGFVRLSQIIGDPKQNIPAVFPIGKSAWWDGIKKGRYPQPVKLGPRTTAWRAEEIHKLIEDPESFAVNS